MEAYAKTKIHKWGGNLAIRIPKSLADQLDLVEGVDVEMTVSSGQLIISPPGHKIPTLEELLAGITPENCHGEWDTGRPVGNEII